MRPRRPQRSRVRGTKARVGDAEEIRRLRRVVERNGVLVVAMRAGISERGLSWALAGKSRHPVTWARLRAACDGFRQLSLPGVP